jgi:hypothetical protein
VVDGKDGFTAKDAAVKGLDVFHRSKDGVITPDSLTFKATERNLAGTITYTSKIYFRFSH